MLRSEIASSGCYPVISTKQTNLFLAKFLGEAQPENLLAILFVLVFVIHVFAIVSLQRQDQIPLTPATPLRMEVSMVTQSAVKAPITPVPVTQSQPIPQSELKKIETKKVESKKVIVKPEIKQTVQLTHKKVEHALTQQPVKNTTVSEPLPAPLQTESIVQSEQTISADAKAAPVKTEPVPEAFTEANYDAKYLNNPKPRYPAIAKERRWQGKVELRVTISATGLSENVEIAHSSGHEMLDEAALEIVKTWRFVPAKRGEIAVVSTRIVPIKFSLTDE